MKKLLTTTAIALIAAAPTAFAEAPKKMDNAEATKTETQNTTSRTDATFYTESSKSEFMSAALVGARVYVTENELNDDTIPDMSQPNQEWDDVGEINNLVISKDGSVKAVLIGVGGFLGIGEKNVAVDMSKLKFMKEKGEGKGSYFVVFKSSKEELESAPKYQTSMNTAE